MEKPQKRIKPWIFNNYVMVWKWLWIIGYRCLLFGNGFDLQMSFAPCFHVGPCVFKYITSEKENRRMENKRFAVISSVIRWTARTFRNFNFHTSEKKWATGATADGTTEWNKYFCKYWPGRWPELNDSRWSMLFGRGFGDFLADGFSTGVRQQGALRTVSLFWTRQASRTESFKYTFWRKKRALRTSHAGRNYLRARPSFCSGPARYRGPHKYPV